MPAPPRLAHRLARVARWIAPPLFLALLVTRVDLRAAFGHLKALDLRYAAAFVALSAVFYLLCAWRWSYTARRLGVGLSFREAVRDYYLSTLLNQVLPIGVAGDVVRAVRHRRRLQAEWGPPVRAIVLERLSGVLGLASVVAVSALAWMARGQRGFVTVLALVLVAMPLVIALLALRPKPTTWITRFVADARAALLAHGAFAVQLATSVAAVALLSAMFACAARAVGVSLDASTTLCIAPMVLAATTIPWAFAGWGARELSVAALFGLAGLEPAAGVAVSVAFGALSLAAAVPGVLALIPRKVLATA